LRKEDNSQPIGNEDEEDNSQPIGDKKNRFMESTGTDPPTFHKHSVSGTWFIAKLFHEENSPVFSSKPVRNSKACSK
jgi:hypothetical protein